MKMARPSGPQKDILGPPRPHLYFERQSVLRFYPSGRVGDSESPKKGFTPNRLRPETVLKSSQFCGGIRKKAYDH